jgi:hypothetical protein
MIYKALHRKLNIEQDEINKKTGVTSEHKATVRRDIKVLKELRIHKNNISTMVLVTQIYRTNACTTCTAIRSGTNANKYIEQNKGGRVVVEHVESKLVSLPGFYVRY